MAPPKRQPAKGKTVSTSLGPILENVEEQSTIPAPPESMITREELEQVMSEMENRFAAQQKALVDQLMSRLGGIERPAHNTQDQTGSRSEDLQEGERLPHE